jgi:activator of HSP90 ATPase
MIYNFDKQYLRNLKNKKFLRRLIYKFIKVSNKGKNFTKWKLREWTTIWYIEALVQKKSYIPHLKTLIFSCYEPEE